MADTGSTDIPEISVEWYRDVVDVAADTRQPVQWFAVHFTEGVDPAARPAAGGRRRARLRRGEPAGPGARPGRAGDGHPGVRVQRDGSRQWWTRNGPAGARPGHHRRRSAHRPVTGRFPSNHATIAGALAAADAAALPRWGCSPLPLALLAALLPGLRRACTTRTTSSPACCSALLVAAWHPAAGPPAAEVLRRRADRADASPRTARADRPRSASERSGDRQQGGTVPSTRNGPNGRWLDQPTRRAASSPR